MERLSEGKGGWVRYEATELPVPVFLRLADRDGRLVIDDLFIPSVDGAGINTSTLRRIPLGRIEAWVNAPDTAQGLRGQMALPAPDLRRAVSYYAMGFGRKPYEEKPNWVVRMFAAQFEGSDEPQPAMEPLTSDLSEPDFEKIDARLDVPQSRDKGDEFYKQVANMYAVLSRYYVGPAAIIAEQNKVPVTTVHRWVKEARRRGFLPAGRSGKAG